MTKLLKVYPYIILLSALLVSTIGSYYSIYGIGRIFAGHQLGATLMAFSLELGNIVTASTLKIYWNDLPKMLRNYLCSAVFLLSIITSIGIYGFLSDGYQLTYNKDKIIESKIQIVERKKERFESQVADYKKEVVDINTSLSSLRKSLSTDNQYQTVDKRGNVLTQIQSTSKKGVQQELNTATARVAELSLKIDNLNDSISTYEVLIIELKSNNEVSAELGALKYISNISGSDMNSVVNWFLILLMVVFQPLAIALLLAALFAFNRKDLVQDKPIEEPETLISEPPVLVEEIPLKKERKKRIKKVLEETDMDYPKTFNIEIEGMEPINSEISPSDKIVDVPTIEQDLSASEVLTEKKPKKRRVVERSLTDDLARHISDSINKKKD